MRPVALALALALIVGLVSRPVAAADQPLAGFEESVTAAMKAHEVPGLAIAVVKDGAVVLARGFGVRELGKPDPVTPDTLFAVGSCTKAFTAALLGQLADDGKLDWDDKVIDHLPGFRLADPYATRELTIRDTLAHRCGLVRHDLIWIGSPHTRAEFLKLIGQIPPDYSFRGKFSYNNGMYLVAGETAAAVAGRDWDGLVAERLFRPLGMTRSNTSTTDLPKQQDVATPHDRVDGRWAPVPWRNIDNMGPAGSINSSASDMARWIRFQLGDGTVAGKRLLAASTLKQMHSAQTVVPIEGIWAKRNPESHLLSYGLGWFLCDYHGQKLVEHSGSIDGMIAKVGLLPELGLGLVVLSNREGTKLPPALMYDVFDRYLGRSGKDWSGEMLKLDLAERDEVKQQEKADEERRIEGTRPSFPADGYAGTYADDLHGPCVVTAQGGRLSAAFHGFAFDLEPWHRDTFRALDRDKRLPRTLWTFSANDEGKVGGLKGSVFEEALDLKRQPDAVVVLNLPEADLKRFAGRYEAEAQPLEVEIELANGALRASVAGGRSVTLAAIQPTRFRLIPPRNETAEKGSFLDFDLADDAVTGATLDQGGVKTKLARKR